MIVFLHGGDDFRINTRRLVLQKAFLKKHPQADCFVFDFEDQKTPDTVRRALAACETGLFATQKIVTLFHPFDLEEPAEKALLHFLEQFVKQTSDVVIVFVASGIFKKTHPLVRFLTKYADTEEILEKLKGAELIAYIKRTLAHIDNEAQFSSVALDMFARTMGANTARIQRELEKLATFKPAGIFEVGDIELMIGVTSEQIIFDALDALGSGNRERAFVLFRRETAKPDGVFLALSMCAWQVRRMLLVREAVDTGRKNVADIATYTQLPPFVVQKMLGITRYFSSARIIGGLALLSQFDSAFKQGKMDPYIALDLFVWKF